MESDITLVNLNLMYAVVDGAVDYQAYLPLGLLSIASVLEKEGYRIDFRDYQLILKDDMSDPFNLESFSHFMTESANIIGISCMSNLLPFALLAAKRLKKENSDCTIILGGVGPTGAALEIMKQFSWIDYVCCGEGERSVASLMRALRAGKVHCRDGARHRLPGYYLRNKTKIQFVSVPRVRDLDELPVPAYHLVNLMDYDGAHSILGSRGCTYRCTFCTETNHWDNQVVFRDIERVIAEIRYIAEHSAKKVFLFQDDQINLKRAWSQRLLERLIEENLGMYWKSFARVDLLDEELLSLMTRAGCIQVRFGVESGSNSLLRRIKKGFTIEQAFEAAKMALTHVPSVHVSFIWGFPFETVPQFLETVDWIERFRTAGCTVLNFLLSPLPNSQIFMDYDGPLDFNENIMANFNCSGGENLIQEGTTVFENARFMFDFVRQHPRIFPGFYLYDYRGNVRPKMSIIEKNRRLVFREMKDTSVDDYELVDL
jgi:radical SAM superfamily enzyme YgiQ (UPF0313 family)